jgi:hypothetical protein
LERGLSRKFPRVGADRIAILKVRRAVRRENSPQWTMNGPMRSTWRRALGIAASWVALQGWGTAQDPAQPSEARPARVHSGDEAGPFRNYRGPADADEILSGWLATGFAERLELGKSPGGRSLLGVQFGGKGPLPLSDRTTVFLLGGLDGISLAGGEAVVFLVDALLGAPEGLPPSVTFVAVPWASPDGLARRLQSGAGDGRNDRPFDDDHDGKLDEDAPDDLDGDALLLDMLIEDPAGAWTFADDPRFLRPVESGDSPRFLLTTEGRDDDEDGRFNEDPPGGVVIDRNFPVGWRGGSTSVPTGAWPLSEPESRGLADLMLARRSAIVLLFQGSHGMVACPGGVPRGAGGLDLPLAADEGVFRGLTDLFQRSTGRNQDGVRRLAEAYGVARPGAALDWFYAALGALTLEIGAWGPNLGRDALPAVDAEFQRALPGGQENLPALRDRAWARWLDDTRGGIGFVQWQPVELDGARRAWVGGWQPFTRIDPPAELLPGVMRGLDAFVREIVRGLPSLELEVLEASREGRVGLVRARITNQGWLSSGVGPAAAPLGLVLTLELPQGVSLLAGEPVRELAHLPGRGTSVPFEWLLVAPEETPLRLTLTSPWMPPVVREVRL